MSMESRRSVNLRTLPLYVQYVLASAIAALVMAIAWKVGRDRPAPAWVGPTMAVWMWIGPGLLAFFVAKGLLNRIRRRNAARRSGESDQP